MPKTSMYQAVQTEVANMAATVEAVATQTAIPTIVSNANVIMTTVANAVGTEVAIFTQTVGATIPANVYAIETAVANAVQTQVAIATQTTVPQLAGDVDAIQTAVANAVHTQEAIQTLTPVQTLDGIYSIGTAAANAVGTVAVIFTQTIVPTVTGNAEAIQTVIVNAAQTAEANITQTVVPTINGYIGEIQTAVSSITSTEVPTQVMEVILTAQATVIAAGSEASAAAFVAVQTAVAVIGYSGLANMPYSTFTQTDGTLSFEHSVSGFWIGQREVTYELWYTVYQWAINNGYYFANAGREGSDGVIGAPPTTAKYEPVTNVSWRDAIVWCNAYSQVKGLTPCYTDSFTAESLKDSRDTNAVHCDTVLCDWWVNGFRLPSEGQWQAAASYMDGYNWTPYNYASGALDIYSNAAATGLVAWYSANSGASTKNTGSKSSNSLGVFDMSGNVREWCWDLNDAYPNFMYGVYDYTCNYATGTERIVRGGSFQSTADALQVGYRAGLSPATGDASTGFRVARGN